MSASDPAKPLSIYTNYEVFEHILRCCLLCSTPTPKSEDIQKRENVQYSMGASVPFWQMANTCRSANGYMNFLMHVQNQTTEEPKKSVLLFFSCI